MYMTLTARCWYFYIVGIVAFSGCQSSSYAQRGTIFGGLGGAGIGALIGRATGHTAAGAAIGAGVGAVTGAAVGSSLDDIDARNRAEIAAQLGRQVTPGAATPEEVISMTQAGVAPQLIVNYVNRAGMVRPITAQDVIYLHQQGVNTDVIQAMQTPGAAYAPPDVVRVAPPRQTVIIEDDPWGPPYCYPRDHVSFGFGGCGCR
jgi:hypothetical protein